MKKILYPAGLGGGLLVVGYGDCPRNATGRKGV